MPLPLAVEFRENETAMAARKKRIVLQLLKIGLAVLASLWLALSNWPFVGSLAVFAFAAAVLFGVMTIGFLRAQKMPNLVAYVDSEGFQLRRNNGQLQKINWANVRYIDAYDQMEQKQRDSFFVSFERPDGKSETLPIPLQLMPPDISLRFVEAMKRYWPDIFAPWQDQLSRHKVLDGGAR
ncbi:hypothetical protein [Roseibium sp. RKSG952]|uniref:hypothetical protein n=1 Tax=Roseibium sp. RKSG952 TaxID=2529384 RepID=UPI0012BC5757|nr:hypothetical protein [Roseibium sp. RKSG952]MTI03761.1 hypothetical protein [Roseibium sp. RKSG952]